MFKAFFLSVSRASSSKVADRNMAASVPSNPPSEPENIYYDPTPVLISDSEIPRKGKNWWTDIPFHDVIYQQRFAYDLDPANLGKGFTKYAKPIDTKDIVPLSGTSKITNGEDLFQVDLNVNSFDVGELKVKRKGEFIVVSGCHGEKEECGGLVSRSFERIYQLPRECSHPSMGNAVASVYSQGTLVISVPKRALQVPTVRIVPAEESD